MTISFDLSKVDFDKYRTQPELAELSHDEFMKELREFLNTIFETKSVTNIIMKDCDVSDTANDRLLDHR